MLDGTIHDRGSGPSDREEFQYDWWAPEWGGPEWVCAGAIVNRRTAAGKVVHSLVSMGSTAAIFTESALPPPHR